MYTVLDPILLFLVRVVKSPVPAATTTMTGFIVTSVAVAVCCYLFFVLAG